MKVNEFIECLATLEGGHIRGHEIVEDRGRANYWRYMSEAFPQGQQPQYRLDSTAYRRGALPIFSRILRRKRIGGHPMPWVEYMALSRSGLADVDREKIPEVQLGLCMRPARMGTRSMY